MALPNHRKADLTQIEVSGQRQGVKDHLRITAVNPEFAEESTFHIC
jgi:hypothetical protein